MKPAAAALAETGTAGPVAPPDEVPEASVRGSIDPVECSPAWPDTEGRRVVFLLDASSALELRLLGRWVEWRRPEAIEPATVEVLPIPPTRRRRRGVRVDPRLDALLASGEDPLLAPLRVAWLAKLKRDGSRVVTVTETLMWGDPRDPGPVRQAVILKVDPERCRIVAGKPAPLSELRERWQRASRIDRGETTGLADFVVRQASLSLERAERRVRGSRYKIPRLLDQDILARPAFRGSVAEIARREKRSEASVQREARNDLKEIAAAHDATWIDLAAQLFRRWIGSYYSGRVHYDLAELERIAALSQRHAVVFLPSHKSNLDHPVLATALYENGFPSTHTAGGINMNFFPLGPIVRRAGVFFIRRSFKDDDVYKLVLRHYLDYLVEKRFSLEWYLEGGRSRHGKLLPPRYGMLGYIVDAVRRRKADDVKLVPVSIAYEQIGEIEDYVREQRGGGKRRESAMWLWKTVRPKKRRIRSDIHVRFGEPLSVAKRLPTADKDAVSTPAERQLVTQKIAFEVCVRINRVTPITPISLVSLALLGVGDRALTIEEIQGILRNVLDYTRRKELPTTGELDLDTVEGVERACESLVVNGVLQRFAEGPETVYMIGPQQHLAAAYYRNTIIHFFVTGAIAEVALLRAAAPEVMARTDEFLAEALRVRDLLKFEFFFPERDEFRRELWDEVAFHDPGWQSAVEAGPAEIHQLVRRIRPFSAHRVLRTYLESYRVVADVLSRWDPDEPVTRPLCTQRAMALGQQYLLQRRIRRAESVSLPLFQTALELAGNRGLVKGDGRALAARRAALADEIDDVIRRVDAIEALAQARRSGVA